MNESPHQESAAHPASTSPVALIAVAWLLVGLPLAYGIIQTLSKAASLFGG